jgi:hypothetical protein
MQPSSCRVGERVKQVTNGDGVRHGRAGWSNLGKCLGSNCPPAIDLAIDVTQDQDQATPRNDVMEGLDQEHDHIQGKQPGDLNGHLRWA